MVRGHFPQMPPKMKKISQIIIASAHKHSPRNNPAKFQNYPMDGLGVADKEPLYMYIKEMVLGGISQKIPPNEKIPN